ncbi:phosphoheptose isomerase [Treponema sp.]
MSPTSTSNFEPSLAPLYERYPELLSLKFNIGEAAALLVDTYAKGGKLLVCGNGGSAADADHIVGELMKGFVRRRPLAEDIKKQLLAVDTEFGGKLAESLQSGLPAISLTQHTALVSAFSNDVDPAMLFAQQVLAYGKPGDLFWGITTSGNSRNVLYGAIAAKARGMKVIGMTGKSGGKMAPFCDVLLAVPETETYKVQELHLPVYHALCLAVEAAFLRAGDEVIGFPSR